MTPVWLWLMNRLDGSWREKRRSSSAWLPRKALGMLDWHHLWHQISAMDIVQDTNFFVSALRSADGSSAAVVERCILGKDKPFFGAALLAEYEEKVEDAMLWSDVPVTLPERRALLASLLAAAQWHNAWFSWRPNLPDPDDDHVMELAINAGVERLVTWNTKDFKRGEMKFARPRIVTPKEHLRTAK